MRDLKKAVHDAARAPFNLGAAVDAAGRMPPGAEPEFLRLVVDEAPNLGPARGGNRIARVEPTNSKTSYIDRVGLSNRNLRKPTTGTEFTTLTNPTLERVTLVTELAMLAYDLGIETVEDNIENGTLSQTLQELYATGFANDLEDLLWNGDTSDTSGDQDFLNIMDGLRVLATAGTSNATIVDTNGSEDFLNVVFPTMIRSMPEKWRRNLAQLIIVTSPNTISKYLEQHIGRETARGDQIKETGAIPSVLGVEVTASPKLTDGHHFLSLRQNVIVRIQRGLRFKSEEVIRKGVTENTLVTRLAQGVRNDHALVYAFDQP